MKRFVIINGDDFGFSRGVNQAIIQAYEQGILTSTSLMVTGDAFEEAVTLAETHPHLAVGLHLVLCCGKSVLSPQKIPHLVDAERNFYNNPIKAGLIYQFSTQARQELRQEIRAQLEKFRQTGLALSHVDGHLHLHVHPVVLKILSELAEEFSVPVVRLPSEELNFTLKLDRTHLLTKIIWSTVFSLLRNSGEKLLKTKNIRTSERVYGLLQTGKISEDYLLGLIPQIRANIVEIYAHPSIALEGEPRNGSSGSGKLELEAFLSQKVAEILNTYGFQLTNYNQLGEKGLQ
jgi:hopanoid biosynthesis associated protein HpnK